MIFAVKDLIMKKLLGIVLALIFIFGIAFILPEKENNYDYLRLHIRANSNSIVDQNVKYKIKDDLVNYLTPYFCKVKTKPDAIELVKNLSISIKNRCVKLLRQNGLNYSVNVLIKNEYFPSRTYDNTTLESGYYDAVIIQLGDAVGDNWWCVMYPPLCFVNKNENTMQIKYKSKIVEWFKSLFN